MFSKGLFIIIPCLLIVFLLCWAWFPLWILVRACRTLFGTSKPEDGREGDGRPSAGGRHPPAMQPTAYHQEQMRHKYYLRADPKEAKRRLVFRNKAEREAYEAMFKTKKRQGGGAQKGKGPGPQGAQARGEHSQRRSPWPMIDGQEVEGLRRPEPAVTPDREGHL